MLFHSKIMSMYLVDIRDSQLQLKEEDRSMNKVSESNRSNSSKSVDVGKENRELYFKDALYYPYIEFPNELWLKTACLYWDSISTIVPSGTKPYISPNSSILYDAHILSPLYVDNNLPELSEVANDVLSYLLSADGQVFVNQLALSSSEKTRVEKFSKENNWALIHDLKFQRGFIHELQHLGLSGGVHGRWIRVPSTFAHYYMTILATHLAGTKGKSLLTDTIPAEKIATNAALGASFPVWRSKRTVPAKITEGLLASLVLKMVEVGPRTSIKKIINFREKHSTELGRLRSSIRELVNTLHFDIEPELLSSHVQTVYSDKVLPAIDDLRGRLQDNRITFGLNNLKVSTLISATPTAIGAILSDTSLGPFALTAGIGLSIVLSTANYRIQRKEILRNSPFSYVISAENAFGKKKA